MDFYAVKCFNLHLFCVITMFVSGRNAYIKDLNDFMNFKGGVHECMYMYGNTKSAFTTEPLNGCLRNLVGMKCSWSLTSVLIFWPCIRPGVDPGRGQNR